MRDAHTLQVPHTVTLQFGDKTYSSNPFRTYYISSKIHFAGSTTFFTLASSPINNLNYHASNGGVNIG